MIAEKKCSKCKEVKPLGEYHRRAKAPDGAQSYCKQCSSALFRAGWAQNRERYRLSSRAWHVVNKTRRSAYQREWLLINKTHSTEWARAYREKNKERIAVVKRKWNAKNRQQKQFDPAFRSKRLLRSRLTLALRKVGYKSAPTEKLLGCSFAEARTHIESQFKAGMSWSAPSSFHIDHIIPCAFFDLTDSAHQRMCFCYLNLQPLTPEENIRKGDTLPPHHEEFLEALEVISNGRATL